MTKQVRISDENADWLGLQGGSLSAAADRTLGWAREAMEAVERLDDDAPDEPVDSHDAPPAGDAAPAPRANARLSSRRASAARFAAAARRPW